MTTKKRLQGDVMRQTGNQARKKRTRRNRSQRQLRLTRGLRYLRTGAFGALLAGMLIAFALVVGFLGNGNGSIAGGADTRSASSGGWVHLRSTAPADVVAAVRNTPLYQEVADSPQTRLGQALRSGTLGTPVLVHVYRPTPGMSDVWVVPVLATSLTATTSTAGSHVVALLDFAYDARHARIHSMSFAGPFVPSDPEYGQPFPRLSSNTALARMQAAQHLALASGRQPQLVYFPVNLDALNNPHSALKWTGGGQFPDLAVWRIPATNGQDYVVGVDGNVYAAAQLPLAPNAGR